MFDKLEAIFKAKFPVGVITASKGALGGNTLFIRFTLNDKAGYLHGYAENDQMRHLFAVYDNTFLEKVTGSIAVKPSNTLYAMEHVKVPFRKATGEAAIIKAFERYINRLHDKMVEVGSNLYAYESLSEHVKAQIK